MSTHPVRKTNHSSNVINRKPSRSASFRVHPHVRDAAAPAHSPHLSQRPLSLTNVEVFTLAFWGAALAGNRQHPDQPADELLLRFHPHQPAARPALRIQRPRKKYRPRQTHRYKNSLRSRARQNCSGFRHPIATQVRTGQRELLPPSNANSLYFVFLPPGATSGDKAGSASCTEFCGYHDATPRASSTPPCRYPELLRLYRGGIACFPALTSTQFARTLRSDHRSGPRPGLVRRQQRRNRRHLRLENQATRRLHCPARMVQHRRLLYHSLSACCGTGTPACAPLGIFRIL